MKKLFSKKINRQLYKVNEGVDINDKSYPNIMNVTSSFVVAGDLFIWLFNELGFKNFKNYFAFYQLDGILKI